MKFIFEQSRSNYIRKIYIQTKVFFLSKTNFNRYLWKSSFFGGRKSVVVETMASQEDDIDESPPQQPLESLLTTKRRLQQCAPSSAYPKKQNTSPQSTYLNYLRGWLGAMFLISFANSVQSFVDIKFLSKSIYTSSPGSVNPLMARLFGMWTLVSALLRICCAVDFTNRMLYHVTVFSFLLSTGHFFTELLWFQTAGPGLGIIMSLLFSGSSAIAMILGYWFLPQVKELKKS